MTGLLRDGPHLTEAPRWLSRWLPRWAVRARERGQKADSPTGIPAAGWFDVALRTVRAAIRHDVSTLAAGITFYAMLALIPALSAFAALSALSGAPVAAVRQVSALDGLAPNDALALIAAEVRRTAPKSHAELWWISAGGLAAAVGSLNAGVMALLSGLNVAYGEKECRSFVGRGLVAAGFTAGVIGLVLLTFGSLLAGRALAEALGAGFLAVHLCRFLFLALLTGLSLALLYRYGPCRPLARWRWVTPGGLLAALAWLGCSSVLVFYLAHFAHYQRTYGVLGAVMAVMVWLWTASLVTLLGAQLNAELEAQTDRDTRAPGAAPPS